MTTHWEPKKPKQSKPAPPNPETPEGWLAIHRQHGRGPFYDCKIGTFHQWRCACGQRFTFTDEDRQRYPQRYMIDE